MIPQIALPSNLGGECNLALEGADGVNQSQSRPSSRFDSIGGALEIRDGRVDFECFRQVCGAL